MGKMAAIGLKHAYCLEIKRAQKPIYFNLGLGSQPAAGSNSPSSRSTRSCGRNRVMNWRGGKAKPRRMSATANFDPNVGQGKRRTLFIRHD